MGREFVHVDRSGEVAVVTLQKAPANALDIEFTETIADVFNELAHADTLGAVVFTGKGSSFCAGLDLKSVPGFQRSEKNRFLSALNRVFYSIYDFPAPVVGAINGHALAGGLILALCCDWRIAAQTSFQVGFPEVRFGIPYPAVGIEIIRTELDPRLARELALFGKNMAQELAVERGLFDESVASESLLEYATKKAEEFANLPTIGFQKIKRQLRSGTYHRIQEALNDGDPLHDYWLSEETLSTVAQVLKEARKKS